MKTGVVTAKKKFKKIIQFAINKEFRRFSAKTSQVFKILLIGGVALLSQKRTGTDKKWTVGQTRKRLSDRQEKDSRTDK